MKIRLAADLQTDSIVDGLGIRTVIWTQGCPHNCPVCHNKIAQDYNYGEEFDETKFINRIKDGPAKSKTIILLTDGTNNAGDIAPVTAAEIAATFGVRVYTIGVGTQGEALYPVQTPYGITYKPYPVEIDETTLRNIASKTGGEYFRATDKSALKDIFEEIDKLEKTKLSVTQFNKKEEVFMPWILLAFLLLCADIILRNTILKNIP